MSRPEGARFVPGSLLVVGAMLAATAVRAEPAPYRYRAPIAIDAPAPFVTVPLPVAAYGHVEQDDLRDLRIVDARGERVPFAVLPPLATVQLSEQVREASLYPLPARPTADGSWPSPVEVVVEGDRISVRRRGAPAGTVAAAPRESGGWLIDSGEPRRGEPPPKRLTLRWSGPAEFSVAYRIETSDDLRQWRAAGSGQLMALQSASGTLAQPVVALPESPGRFVRLVWADAGAAPALTGASVLVAERQRVAVDSTRELTVAPSGEPPAPRRPKPRRSARCTSISAASMPLVDVDLRFDAGHARRAGARARARARRSAVARSRRRRLLSPRARRRGRQLAAARRAGRRALPAPGSRRARGRRSTASPRGSSSMRRSRRSSSPSRASRRFVFSPARAMRLPPRCR